MGKRFLIILSIFVLAGIHAREITFFSRENTAWQKKSHYIDGKRSGCDFKNGRIYIECTETETPQSYMWCAKPFPVTDCDFLKLQYKSAPGNKVVVDLWWDTAPKKQLRPIYGITDGTWQNVKIPVKGKQIMKLTLYLETNKSDGMDELWIKPLEKVNSTAPEINRQYFTTPLLMPEVKEYKACSQRVRLVVDGVSCFTVTGNGRLSDIIRDELNMYLKSPLPPSKDTPVEISLENIEDKSQPEGYEITFKPGKIILKGNGTAGLYWAFQTFRQMLYFDTAGVYVTAANIRDWPDLPYRSIGIDLTASVKEKPDMADFGLAVKINHHKISLWKGWQNNKKIFQSPMFQYALDRGTEFVPYILILKTGTKDKIQLAGDNAVLKELIEVYKTILAHGNKNIFLAIDDSGRDTANFTEADRQLFENDILLWQANLIKKLAEAVYETNPDAWVFTCTRNYETAKGVDKYFAQVGVPQKVNLVWTGLQCVTFDYPKDVIDKYVREIDARDFIIYDNTPGQYWGMYRRLCLMETHASGYGNLMKTDKYKGSCAAVSPSNELAKIKSVQTADYLWNAKTYDPERSRQRAVAYIAGNSKVVRELLLFMAEYQKIALKYPIDKRFGDMKFKDFCTPESIVPVCGWYELMDNELNRYCITPEEFTEIKTKSDSMAKLLETIQIKCPNKTLTMELEIMLNLMNKVVKHIHNNSLPLLEFTIDKPVFFDMKNVAGGSNNSYVTDKELNRCRAVIYGNQTPYSKFIITFNMNQAHPGDIQLTVTSKNCDKNLANMEVWVNGTRIFSGLSPFAQEWKDKMIIFPGNLLNPGRNSIEIRNSSASSDFIDHWLMLGGVKLEAI